MNTSDLKLDLIRAISAIDNLELLQKIHQLLSFETTESKIYHFSEEQLSEINEALEQYKNGNYMTEEEAERDIQKWFEDEEK